MREIKFRGARIDNNKWVYGCLTRYSDTISYITVDLVQNEVYQVHTDSVGQYTGFKDRYEEEIYENSILKVGEEYNPETDELIEDIAIVKWGKLWGYQLHLILDWCGISNNIKSMEYSKSYQVVGSLYKNPDLIPVKI